MKALKFIINGEEQEISWCKCTTPPVVIWDAVAEWTYQGKDVLWFNYSHEWVTPPPSAQDGMILALETQANWSYWYLTYDDKYFRILSPGEDNTEYNKIVVETSVASEVFDFTCMLKMGDFGNYAVIIRTWKHLTAA